MTETPTPAILDKNKNKSNDDVNFDVTDAPTPEEDEDTTYIVHRTPDGKENRMPMTDWPAYAKKHNL